MLDGDGAILHLDGLLHRDDVHADARASGRHHGRRLREGPLRGLLEELRDGRVLLDLARAHVEELGGAGHEHGQNPLLGAGGILPVVLEQADIAHLVEELLERLGVHPGGLDRVGQGVGATHLHLEEDVGHLIGRDLGKRPVLEGLELLFAQQTVGAVLAQRHDLLARVLGDGRDEFGADVGLGERDSGTVYDHVDSFRAV